MALFRNPLLIRIVAWCIARINILWMSTVRVEIDPVLSENHDPRKTARGIIYVFWHEDLFYLGYLVSNTPTDCLISRSRDGEYFTQILHSMKVGTVRGSTNRGGAQAILQVMRSDENRNLGVTPDGPRGPRRNFQAGAIFLASRSGMPIIPIAIGYQNAWRAKSWDRTAFAKPFSRIVLMGGPLTHIPPDIEADEIETYRQQMELTLNELHDRADARAINLGKIAPENDPTTDQYRRRHPQSTHEKAA
ncbi:MAG: lysophospholipid acyltransferase family protein [Pirellulales bacterium]